MSRRSMTSLCYVSDVDVAEPDERSLITYVSSLYDVFPDVPPLEQSLADNVSACVPHSQGQGKIHDSRELCANYLFNMRGI